jgi:hypothetical protein
MVPAIFATSRISSWRKDQICPSPKSFAPGRKFGGTSDEPGVFGLTQQIVSPVGGGTMALSFQNMMVAAHEIGHNFFGTHAMADCICVDDALVGCWDYRRTLMWPEFHGDNFPRFSDGTHNPAHNNKKSVRDFMTGKGF